MNQHVAVLMGGWSSEREVSLVSGAAVTRALESEGYRVTTIDVQRNVDGWLSRLTPKPDVAFNALHGRYGEDGCIQGLLNMLQIPYTHSGVLASALAMDKPMAKRLFDEVSIPVARHVIANRDAVMAGDVMARPYVVKPLNEGSSVGVHIVHEGDNALPFDTHSWPYGETVMVEAFVAGRELTVSVVGDRALAVTEIATDHEFYDYDAKYANGGSRHTIPADIPDAVAEEAKRLAVLAHQTLGCRGVSRADFRYDGERLVILEVNTQPGLTPTSLVPEQAAHVGMSFGQLVSWMIEQAEYDA